KRYDLAFVGRYKMNKKLDIKNRLLNQTLAETVVDGEKGEVLAQKGDRIYRQLLNTLTPLLDREVDKLSEKTFEITEGSREEYVVVQSIQVMDSTDPEGERELTVLGNGSIGRDVKNITTADIVSSINYFFNTLHNVGFTDDIDHLGNRRLRSVGELLQNQFRKIGRAHV